MAALPTFSQYSAMTNTGMVVLVREPQQRDEPAAVIVSGSSDGYFSYPFYNATWRLMNGTAPASPLSRDCSLLYAGSQLHPYMLSSWLPYADQHYDQSTGEFDNFS